MMDCGLIDRDWMYINDALGKFPEIRKAILFGSRASGNFKQGSDVDLAVVGDRVTHETLVELNDLLNETYPLPYVFDLHHFDSITNDHLKQQVTSFGKEIYHRSG